MRWEAIRRNHEYELLDGDLSVGTIERVADKRWYASDAEGSQYCDSKDEAEEWLLKRRGVAVLHARCESWLDISHKWDY